jgi:SAM-dependent methyltransferase
MAQTSRTSLSKTGVHESIKHQYANYVGRGGDGESVLSDRGERLGYDKEFLESCGLKTSGHLFAAFCGSGCPLRLPGGPVAGETVIDFGCGAGHDVIVASCLVGNIGRVIGIDVTPEMIEAARKSVEIYQCKADNIELLCAAVDDPEELGSAIDKNCADVVISNGVFNLCSDKRAAFAMAFRALKPGGRFLLSDVCRVENNPSAAVSCSVGDGWSS